jgi:hypothetical protein
LRVIAFVAVCGVGEVLSVALKVIEKEPAAVGVPETVPFAAKLTPAGSEPEAMDQAYPGVPPEADRACEYGNVIAPFGKVLVVIDKAAVIVTE